MVDVYPEQEANIAGHLALRTCIGCRVRVDSSQLVRLVLRTEGQPNRVNLLVDLRRQLPGRGAWLHPQRRCFEQAVRRHAFARALKSSDEVDLTELVAFFATTHANVDMPETTTNESGKR